MPIVDGLVDEGISVQVRLIYGSAVAEDGGCFEMCYVICSSSSSKTRATATRSSATEMVSPAREM